MKLGDTDGHHMNVILLVMARQDILVQSCTLDTPMCYLAQASRAGSQYLYKSFYTEVVCINVGGSQMGYTSKLELTWEMMIIRYNQLELGTPHFQINPYLRYVRCAQWKVLSWLLHALARQRCGSVVRAQAVWVWVPHWEESDSSDSWHGLSVGSIARIHFKIKTVLSSH